MPRTENNQFNYPCYLEFLRPDDTVYETGSPQYRTAGSLRTRSDIVKRVPDDSGWREPTPYSLSFRRDGQWSGEFVYGFYTGPNKRRLSGPSIVLEFGIPEHLVDVPPWLVTKAQNKALIKLKNANVHYAVALSELHKSFGLAKTVKDAPKGTLMAAVGSLQLFADAYRSARKGRWREAARALGLSRHRFKASSKDASKRWLELQYGWLPLLQDFHGSWQDFQRDFLKRRPRFSVRAVVKEKLPVALPDVITSQGARATVSRRRGWISCTVRLDYQVDDIYLRQLAQIGLTDPLSVTWENIPYSFVADWVVPIGDFLEALTATQGMVFKGGSVTTYTTSEITMQSAGTVGAPSNPIRVWKGECTSERTSFARTVLSSSPIPGLYVKNPISTHHALNALALIRQRFR